MSKNLTPQEIADKQVKRAQAATADYKKGVMAVTEAPTKKAAQAVDRWFSGVQKAMDEGTFVDGCNDCTLDDWQKAAVEKGSLTYAKGVADAADTIADFHAQREQVQKRIQGELERMPKGDLQSNIARMVHNATEMSKFKFRKRRR